MNVCSLNSQDVAGDIFVVGDIHGDRVQLLLDLRKAGFDKKKDVLICAGDLVDRGPAGNDYKVLDLLEQPWFVSVKGNHELMYLKARWDLEEDQLTEQMKHSRAFHLKYGGEWAENCSTEQHQHYYAIIQELSYVIDVIDGDRRIGIMHGQNPFWNVENVTWDQILYTINETAESDREWCTFNSTPLDIMVWSFEQSNIILKGPPQFKELMENHQPRGVDQIFFGHAYWYGNYRPYELGIYKYIDLGHYKSKKGFHIEKITFGK